MAEILVLGAGVTGLWQSLTLACRGHEVRLIELSETPFINAASRLGAAMLSPYCEAEASEPIIQTLGKRSLELWRDAYPGMTATGSLVIAAPRDQAELGRFARMTETGVKLSHTELAALEPGLSERHQTALYYSNEALVEPGVVLPWLLRTAQDAGCEAIFGDDAARKNDLATAAGKGAPDWVIDCRGMGASADLPDLRGVRGEMLVIATTDITLSRPVRLLHPRFPLYIAPWRNGRFMIGATVLESSERGAVSVRSALELLSAAFTVHPAFAEAKIESFAADVRPAFSDNIPKIIIRNRRIFVNGLYRHGYLLAPALAGMVADLIDGEDVLAPSIVSRLGA